MTVFCCSHAVREPFAVAALAVGPPPTPSVHELSLAPEAGTHKSDVRSRGWAAKRRGSPTSWKRCGRSVDLRDSGLADEASALQLRNLQLLGVLQVDRTPRRFRWTGRANMVERPIPMWSTSCGFDAEVSFHV